MAELHEDLILESVGKLNMTGEELDIFSDFLTELDDEQQVMLYGLLQEDPSWAKILVDNILEKGRVLAKNDFKAWQELVDHEDLALARLAL